MINIKAIRSSNPVKEYNLGLVTLSRHNRLRLAMYDEPSLNGIIAACNKIDRDAQGEILEYEINGNIRISVECANGWAHNWKSTPCASGSYGHWHVEVANALRAVMDTEGVKY